MRFSLRKKKAFEIGTLEIEVLNRLWAAGSEIDARSIHAGLSDRAVSLSTVQAALERLHRKGLLSRAKVSRAYFYRADVSREQLIGLLIGNVADKLAAGELEPVISGFVDLVGNADPELLGRLESSARRRREGR